jgi:hypothetical protein
MKMTLRFQLTQSDRQPARQQTTTNAVEDAEKKEPLFTVGQNAN